MIPGNFSHGHGCYTVKYMINFINHLVRIRFLQGTARPSLSFLFLLPHNINKIYIIQFQNGKHALRLELWESGFWIGLDSSLIQKNNDIPRSWLGRMLLSYLLSMVLDKTTWTVVAKLSNYSLRQQRQKMFRWNLGMKRMNNYKHAWIYL